jgi:hypothetical protein
MASVQFGTGLPPLPKSLSYAVSRLNNFSKRKVRLVEQSSTVAAPNSTIKVILPAEVVDLSSMSIFCKLTTTTTTGKASVAHVEDLIESYYLTAGGVQLTPQFAYNDAWELFKDYQLGDKKTIRKLLCTKATAAPSQNLTNEPCAIYSMLGFFNSASPRCIDFGLFPKVELNIRLAGVEALVGSADMAGQSFAISDFYIEADVLSLPDVYYQSMNAYLSAGQILEIPYQAIQTFTASAGSINGLSQQFNISSQSVDAVIATVYDTTVRGSNVIDTDTESSRRFVRGSTDLTGVQIHINNVPQIAYGQATADRSAISVISELAGGLDETATSASTGMNSLAKFKEKFYSHVLRLNHRDAAYGNSLISGMNTLSNPANIMITYTGSGTATTMPVAHVLTTSSILVGQGKAVELRM